MQSFKSVNPIVITAQNSLYEIQKKFGVKRIGIFGSCARNEQNNTSDVDVLVEFNPGKATYDNFIQLVTFLEEIFSRHVDLLTCDGLSKHLRPYIEKEVIWIEE